MSQSVKRAENIVRKALVVGALSIGAWALVGASSRQALAADAPATAPATAGAGNAAPLVTGGIDERTGSIRLLINKSATITTARPYKRVNIGQPDIADVNGISPTRILINGKKAGTTQLIVWDEDDNSQMIDVIVQGNLLQLRELYARTMPHANIEIIESDGVVTLTGQVPTVASAEQAAALAAGYGNKVMNLLEVSGGQQVMLQIRFAEVSRTATSQLGVSFALSDGTAVFGNNTGHTGAFNPAEPLGNISRSLPASANLFGSGVIGSTAFELFVTALRDNNLLRVLAEPNLVCISGQEAEFLAGGDFPVPIVQGGNDEGTSISVEFREFGVKLVFIPVVLGDGRIRLKLNPEVSDVDFSFAVTAQGFRIPGRRTRRLTTTVEMQDGQTFAVGGLLDNRVAANKSVTPLLGDLPVVGALFRSVRYQRNETELVVLVTPRLVSALNPGEVPPAPGESWRNPSELGLFIAGDIGGPREGDSEPKSRPRRFIGNYGFVPAEDAAAPAATPTVPAAPAQSK